MRCCDIDPGQFTVKATVEKKVRTSDGMGGFTEVWSADPAGGIWCSLQNLSGSERWEAMRMIPGNLYRITTWFKGDEYGAPYWSAATHRVVIRNRIHGILAVQDVEGAMQYLKMDLFEGKPS